MDIKVTGVTTEQFVKRMMFLAWQACGGPSGMGFLQNHSGATEDEVWENIQTRGDYPGRKENGPGEVYGDYVFGRMMKFGANYTIDIIKINTEKPRLDYQAWGLQYKTTKDLIQATAKSLNACAIIG